MSVAAQQAFSGQGALAQAARRLATWLPAFLIAYSALFDPLIHFDGNIYESYGGIDIGAPDKSTMLTQIVMPGTFVLTAMLATLVKPHLPARLGWILALLGGFLGLAIASTLWSLSPSHTLKLSIYQTIICTILGLSVAISRDPERIMRNIFWVFFAVVAINLVFAVIRPPGPIGHQGIYPYKNLMGGAAGCAFIFGLFHITDGRLFQRLAALFTVFGAIILLVLSQSKTAMGLAVLAPVGVIGLYVASRLLGMGVVAMTLTAAVMMAVTYFMFSQLTGLDVSDLLVLLFGNDTFTGRTEVWKFVSSYIADAPWLGHGHRGFWGIGDASPKHSSEIEFIRLTGSSHSGYRDTVLDLGYVGLALLIGYLVTIVRLCGQTGLRGHRSTMLYLSIVAYVLGRNAMESVVLWSTFFDAQCLILVGFLAAYPHFARHAPGVRHAVARSGYPAFPGRA